MEVSANKLIVYYQTSVSTNDVATLENKMSFIKKHWETEKKGLLRVSDAFTSAICLGLPFTAYEWNGILPSTPGNIIRLIPTVYDEEGYPTSAAIAASAGYGNDGAVTALLEILPPISISTDDIAIAMTRAASYNHVKCVKILSAYTTIMPKDFCIAAKFGHTGVIVETLPYIGASTIGEALILAASYNHVSTVKVLVETGVVEREDIDEAYARAVRHGHRDVWPILNRYRPEQ